MPKARAAAARVSWYDHGVKGVPALFLAAIGLFSQAKAARETRARVDAALAEIFRHRRASPRRRKPPEAGIPTPAVPPRGPLPMQGGAEAPLDFS